MHNYANASIHIHLLILSLTLYISTLDPQQRGGIPTSTIYLKYIHIRTYMPI
jgi:hypothetical protein